MGKLTCKSFVSNLMILVFSLIRIFFIPCVIACEFLVVYVQARLKLFLSLKNVATYYDGACEFSFLGWNQFISVVHFYVLIKHGC